MDSIFYKVLDTFGINEKKPRSREADRYFDDGYEVHRKKTSSTASSRSDDDDNDTDYDIEKSGSTVEKVEDLVSQMFEACAVNMKGMFNDPSSPTSSEGKSRRRLKGGSGYNVTTVPYSTPYSRSDINNNVRASKSGFSGVSQRKRGTRISSRKHRSISRTRRRSQFQDNTLLPGNKMTLIVRDDDDDVSALSAGTLEEMATRQQRLILLQEAKYLRNIHPGGVQHNMEDLRSTNSFSTITTTDFEGVWNKNQIPSNALTTERVGIYETRDSIPEEGALDDSCKSIPEEDEQDGICKQNLQTQSECDTPLSRKLKRHHRVNSGLQFKTIEEDRRSAFSIRSDEQEI